MISKNSHCLRWLHDCLRRGLIEKRYTALLKGILPAGPQEITDPIRKNITKSGERMAAVSGHGKRAVTVFSRSKLYRDATLASIRIATGRTHQIRVHAAYIRHPVAGDMKYGDKPFNQQLRRNGLQRLFLHAGALSVPAWAGQQPRLDLQCGLPDELLNVLKNIK
jgi:23S rRNA pseudouridine955/2504/2580 synthase